MIRIEITSEPVNVRSGNKDGKQWSRRDQPAYVHTGHAYPARFLISLGDTGTPYAPGTYTLDPKSLAVGQYGDLQIARVLHLTPVKA
jgi:hypothetical protein